MTWIIMRRRMHMPHQLVRPVAPVWGEWGGGQPNLHGPVAASVCSYVPYTQQ